MSLLQLPDLATEFVTSEPLSAPEARRLIKDANVWATVTTRGTSLIGFGEDSKIVEACSSVDAKRIGTAQLRPAEDMIDRGLVYDGLVRAIARRSPVRAIIRGRGHSLVISAPQQERTDQRATREREQLSDLRAAYQTPLEGLVPGIKLRFAEGIKVRIESWDGRWWCVFEPYTWVDIPRRPGPDNIDPSASRTYESARLAASDWRRERWARRYNPWWNGAIAAWAKLIAPKEQTTLSTHHIEGPGIDGEFLVSWTTGWAAPGRKTTGSEPQ